MAFTFKQGLIKEDAEKKAPLILEAQEMLRKWEAGDTDVIETLMEKINGQLLFYASKLFKHYIFCIFKMQSNENGFYFIVITIIIQKIPTGIVTYKKNM